jgi:voltage-gated potassium channel
LKKTRKEIIRHIIFEANTPPSKLFDVLLLWAIVLSVLVVILDSVPVVNPLYHQVLYVLEWIFTILFSIEYALRIWTTRVPIKYIFSVYGIIDLLSVLPTYLSLLLAGTQYLMVIRMLRLLRIFRILKLVSFVKEAQMLVSAIKESRYKLTVFMGFIVSLVVIIGTMMYLIEGPEYGFDSIPHSIYWTIVTMTTVGFGDITPQTVLGRTLASIVMLLGYTIIAVPTGIVSASLFKDDDDVTNDACPQCNREGHDSDARHCKYCGASMSTRDD